MVSFAKGRVNLEKGEKVLIEGYVGDVVYASASWSSEKDYDVLALVEFADGTFAWAAQFGTYQTPGFSPVVKDADGYAIVTHLGDVTGQSASDQQTPTIQNVSAGSDLIGTIGRTFRRLFSKLTPPAESHPPAKETLEIRLTRHVKAVWVVVYSAKKNLSGSFSRWGVSMEIVATSAQVHFDSDTANVDDYVYTCVPGSVRFSPEDGLTIEALEEYSAEHSENRPTLIDGRLVMDRGEENVRK